MVRLLSFCSAAAIAAAFAMPAPAMALTMKECGAKYQAAKEANTLKGMKWNDFRKAECSDDDASEADAAAAEQEAEKAAPKPSAATKTATDKPATEKTAAPKKSASGKASFPSDVSTKYASETPGKARMHTCLDQYRANKEAGVDQPKWIEKGGGYYSQCNAKLKGGA